jgi:DNA modification methylase
MKMRRTNEAPFRDRIVELRRVRAGDLKKNPRNWRRHPKRQVDALRALLAQVGYAAALLAREQDGELILIDGHLRRSLRADQVVPVLVLDVTEEEADLLLATLDPLTSLAEADPDALRDLLSRVSSSSEAVRKLFAELAASAGPLLGRADPEDIPAVPAAPKSRPGDLYLLGDHRVLCGDAREPSDLERLMAGEQARILLTDPPYGVDYAGKTAAALTITNDDSSGIEDLLSRAFTSANGVLVSGAALYVFHPSGSNQAMFLQAFLDQGWVLRQDLCWVKDTLVLGHADYHFRHEPIYYGNTPAARWGRGSSGWFGSNAESTVLEVPRPRASREHPTAKPVELLRRLIANSSAPNDVVLDPFLGSGSTLIAAHQIGRRCYGVEIDPRYVDVAVARWESFTGCKATRRRKR